MNTDMPPAPKQTGMATNQVGSLEGGFEEVGVSSERVEERNLVDAILESAREPAVATPLHGFDESLEDTSITVDPTPAEVWDAHTGITTAEFAITEYGSLYLPHEDSGSEFLSLFVDHHVAVLRDADIVPTMEAAFERLGSAVPESRGSGIIATGPSATADMGELVQGVHGPETVHVIIVMEA